MENWLAPTLVIKKMDPVTKAGTEIGPFIGAILLGSRYDTGYVINLL